MHRALSRYCPAVDGNSELVMRHAGTIERLARRIALRVGIPSALDDLWSAGALGLLDAASRFDPSRNVSFETFVEHRIRGAMLDELRLMDHLPRRLRAQTGELDRVRRKLATALGRTPSSDELAAALDLGLEDLSALEALEQPLLPLEGDLMASGDDVPIDDLAAHAEAVRRLAHAIRLLPERLRVVIGLHYDEGLTYREIARILGVSEPRVCQLHGDAVARLRRTLEGEAETLPPVRPALAPSAP